MSAGESLREAIALEFELGGCCFSLAEMGDAVTFSAGNLLAESNGEEWGGNQSRLKRNRGIAYSPVVSLSGRQKSFNCVYLGALSQ